TFSNAIVGHFSLILLVVIGLIVASVLWVKRPGQRERLDHLVLGTPWAGETIRKFATSQFARTLATLLGGGIPLVNSLEIGARSMTNRFLAREIDEVGRRVREGETFAGALRARGVFP